MIYLKFGEPGARVHESFYRFPTLPHNLSTDRSWYCLEQELEDLKNFKGQPNPGMQHGDPTYFKWYWGGGGDNWGVMAGLVSEQCNKTF